MPNPFYIERRQSPLIPLADFALRFGALREEQAQGRTRERLMQEQTDLMKRGQDITREGNIRRFGGTLDTGEVVRGIEPRRLDIEETQAQAETAKIPVHRQSWSGIEFKQTQKILERGFGPGVGKAVLIDLQDYVDLPADQGGSRENVLTWLMNEDNLEAYRQSMLQEAQDSLNNGKFQTPGQKAKLEQTIQFMESPQAIEGLQQIIVKAFQPTLQSMQMAEAEAKGDSPADIQGYQLAVQQGFQGSFMDYKAQIRPPISPIFTPIPTSGGYLAFNGRAGTTQPIMQGGQPVLPVPADVELAGEKTAAVEEAKRVAEVTKLYPKAREALISDERQWDTVEKVIDKTINQISPYTAGVGSYLSIVPGSLAKDLAENLQTISANITFDKLASLRANSPTGGALGQVSDFENRLMSATQGSLVQKQSPAQLLQNLLTIRANLAGLRAQRQMAFDMDFKGIKPNIDKQSIPIPNSPEEFDALPSGAVYIDPDDGKQYEKP